MKRRDGVAAQRRQLRWRRNWRTPAAKAVYWVAGLLTKVKTKQHTYSVDGGWDEGVEFEDIVWVEHPREWHSIGFAFTVLEWSERLDPRHWEHWALDHSDCELECSKCGWCGGVTCYRDVVGDER